MAALVAWLRGVLDEDERDAHGYLTGGSLEEREHSMPEWRLADITAKRAILALHDSDGGAHQCPGGVDGWGDLTVYARLCPTLRLLASAYASRLGYRPGWAPTSSTEQAP